MRIRAAAAILTSVFLIACEQQTAESPQGDATIQPSAGLSSMEYVSANRDAFDRVVFLFGDSISRGFALGVFPDEVSPQDAGRHPAWRMRAPAPFANLMLRDAGFTQTSDRADEVTGGQLVAVHAGQTGQPSRQGVASARDFISDLVRRGVIRSGDVVVFEDAGAHTADPDAYEDNWRTLRAALGESGVSLIMMSMYDRVPAGAMPDWMSYKYAYVAPGWPRSHNAATHRAAAVSLSGQTALWLDYDAMLASFDQRGAALGVRALRDDNIHPNVWGQCVLSAALVHALGVELSLGPQLREAMIVSAPYIGFPGEGGEGRALDAGALCLDVARAAPRLTAPH